jgi:hypothetical protein
VGDGVSFTNVLPIITKIKDLITGPVTALIPLVTISTDEPINYVFSDLPMLNVYPIKEDFVFDESTNSEDKKHLAVRIELRLAGAPASSLCTPIMNAICAAIKANKRLDGLAVYVELQGLQWANDSTSSGAVSGMSLDLEIQYFTS